MAGAHGIEVADFQFENVAVEKEECAESLILGAGGDLIVRGQMGQELLDFAGPHGVGVFDAEKADVADDPLDVALLGPIGIMLGPQDATHLVEKLHRKSPCARIKEIGCAAITRKKLGSRKLNGSSIHLYK